MFKISKVNVLLTIYSTIMLTCTAVVDAGINDGLVAKYTFNNGDAQDESGSDNDGVLLNGVSLTTDRFGNTNFAYRFDGIDDFIKAKSDNLPVRERTVALWFYVEKFDDNLSDHVGLVPIGYGGVSCATSFFISIHKQSIGVAEHCNGSTLNYNDFIIEEAFGKWNFFTVTTSDTEGTKFFVNGIKVLEDKDTVFGDTSVNGKDLSIGVAVSTTGTAPFTDHNISYFSGKIDDIRIYERAISDAEVLELYNEPNPNPSNINYGLVAYYPFNGNANDESGHENDGIVYGAELTTDRHGNMNSSYLFDRDLKSWIKASADDLPTNERTVSLWFYANDEDSTHIFGYGGGACNGSGTSWLMMIFQKDNAEDAYQVQSHYRDNRVLCKFTQAPIGKWYHWIITTDSSGTRMYVNGECLCVESNVFVNNTFVEGKILSIGTIPDCDAIKPHLDESRVFFDGKIDDVRIYNRSLSETEAKELYNLEKPQDNLCEKLEWKQFQESEYALTENFGTWYDAQIEANRCGGNLVTINDEEENSWLSQHFSDTYTRSNTGNEYNAIAWIGYFFNSQTNNWEWVNGEPILFINISEPIPQSNNFAYLHLNAHPVSPTWGTNPLHNTNHDYNPKGIIERSLSGCISQASYFQAIETERQKWDVNNDTKIGLEEAIHALQVTSGLPKSQSK